MIDKDADAAVSAPCDAQGCGHDSSQSRSPRHCQSRRQPLQRASAVTRGALATADPGRADLL